MRKRLALYNHFLESRAGVLASWLLIVLLLAVGGYQIWRDWPRGKPAAVTHAAVRVVGQSLVLTATIVKDRLDCSFSDDRWAEGKDGLHIDLGGARAQWVTTLGRSTINVSIPLPPDMPPGDYLFRTAGVYDCPEGIYPADAITAPFRIPPVTAPLAQ